MFKYFPAFSQSVLYAISKHNINVNDENKDNKLNPQIYSSLVVNKSRALINGT
jgi:hypothetical protein